MTTEKNNKAPKVTVPQSVKTVLRAKMVAHNKKSKYKVTMSKLEAVYRRGVGAYYSNPSSVRGTVSSARQWGIARVNAWLKGVNGRFPRSAFDLDLFPAGHPRKPKKSLGNKAKSVSVGDYVSWSINKDPDPPSTVHGIVEGVRRSGVVQVGQEKYEASADKPVAIMRVYAQSNGEHRRTDRRVARYFSSLTVIKPWKQKKNIELKSFAREYVILQNAWIDAFTTEYRKILADERRRIVAAGRLSSTLTATSTAKMDSEILMSASLHKARLKPLMESMIIDFGGRILDIYAPEKGFGEWTPKLTQDIETKQTRQEIINRGFYPNRVESPVIGARTPQRLLYNRKAIQMVDESVDTLFGHLSTTQRNRLNRLIRKAAEGNVDYIDLQNQIENYLGEGELSRARTIARTEVRKLSSFAQQQGALLSGKVKKKRWISLSDTWVRDWHRSADGQIRKIDELYNVGGESIMYPGQGSGKNSANCRCTEIYFEV